MSLHHCLLTEIRNHTPRGEHGPPSIWNEKRCSQQKTLWTISFNYSIGARLEGLRGAGENPKGVRDWRDGNTSVVFEAESEWWMLGVLMNLHCQSFHVLMINPSVSAMMHLRTVLCAVDGWIQPSPLIAPVLPPPPRDSGGSNYIVQSLMKPWHNVIHQTHSFHMILLHHIWCD